MTSCALTVGRVEQGLNSLLNSRLAESWDNVGLLIGDRSRVVRRMLLCVDMTRPVLKEARAKRIDFVLAYHPPIFEPLRSMLADTQCNIYQAVQAGLAVYAIHTAFDMILGGTSDALADVVGMEDRKPITPTVRSDRSKLVVFVPQDHVEQVASAVFEAGGGVIGDYTRCSFRTGGSGTFLGSDATTPAVGRSGRFETVAETRLEIVVDNSKLPDTVRRMKRAHPYEEPAFDIYPLSHIDVDSGLGRIGRLAKPATLERLVTMIKRRTGLKHVLVAARPSRATIKTAAVCPGSCGKLAGQIAGKVDLYITGELRHHDALMLTAKGTAVICLGHGNSERPALKELGEMVRRRFPQLSVLKSARDVDPLKVV